ncbi:MAG: RICIN domain-containing protein [Clostridia bacterium]|nr:RICIN domain-containing protein [Clostridia bacterium]
MKRFLSVLIVLTILLSMFCVSSVSAYNTGDDYPEKYKKLPLDDVVDEWNFYNRECTSFVAWCLNSRNGVSFTNQYGGVARWGNANEWGAVAKKLGIAVDNVPAIGSVAWWSSCHVAWVKAIEGNYVIIDEYNQKLTGEYSERRVLASSITGFIHIKDLVTNSYLNIGDDFDAYIMSPHYDDLYVTNISSNVLMKNYSGGKNQIWHFSRDTDGNYKITNRSDKQCLDTSGTTKGANICTQVEDNSDSQRWNLSKQNGAYIITSKESENVLDISGYGNNGDNVQLWVKNSTVNQQFEIKKIDEISGVDIGTNFYATMISPYYENLCVTNNNENAVLNVFLDSQNQKYLFEKNKDDSYKIKSLSTSTYLHADGTGNGANVEFRKKESSENQDWWLNGPVDGMVLTSKVCDYALDISGSGNDGDNLQLWKLNSGANQVFSVNKLDLPSLLSVNLNLMVKQ